MTTADQNTVLGWGFKNREADLVYNIAEELLFGYIDRILIRAYGFAGGRGGSKYPNAVNWFLQNNPMATGVKAPDHPYEGPLPRGPHGGPLPIGLYHMTTSNKRPTWVQLDPFPGNSMFRRRDFFIHPASGPAGSEGCIALSDAHEVRLILSLVTKRLEKNSQPPVLQVMAVGSGLDSKSQTG